MTIQILNIPDTRQELATWLDRQLVDLHLAQLVAELDYVAEDLNPPDFDVDSLDEILSGRRDAVLESGLRVLDYEQCAALLTCPALLLELQELVLIHGGRYWQRLLESDAPAPQQVEKASRKSEPKSAPVLLEPVKSASSSRNYASWIVAVATLVIVVSAGVWYRAPDLPPVNQVVEEDPPKQTAEADSTMIASTWGFDNPAGFDDSQTPSQYLNQLAEMASAWFNKRPESAEDLKVRLAQFRHGCETLLEAPHVALAPEDREWLRERCRTWAEKIETHHAAVESDNVLAVREEADETINRLINALRMKATEVA
ncbi:hypothetical protein [Rubinisphaera margarita]|uniref:hypothetical protein n=1 Tax=Rubinisphaera margarita TaxID=2909586 RepID=UPI001EE8EFC5|nr:hypothetical protein [Rubinisphaera margarita]MCG6156057.1 hypothetical protein [Rubinisphaera margarita]